MRRRAMRVPGAALVTNKSHPSDPNCSLMFETLKKRQPARLVSLVLGVALT